MPQMPKLPLIATVACLAMLFAGNACAGKYNIDIDIGQAAPKWSDLPGVDGKQHSLEDLKESEVVVVVFTCNSCGYATEYEDRIIDFATRFCVPKTKAEGQVATKPASEDSGPTTTTQPKAPPTVALVAINVNKVEEDLLPAMKERAQEKKFPFPYLFDETQKLAKDYGAITTPEFFVLNKERKVVYMGAFDDSTDAKKVKKRFVEAAVVATLADKPIEVTETVAIGCRIRFDRRSRSRRKRKP